MASLLQILGAATVSIGVGLIFIPAGLIVAGILLITFGLSLEKN